jgi:3-hydroxy-3-methylglutaryl CoA synthase
LQETDYLCFHTPFYKMIQKAYDALARTERPNAQADVIMNEFAKKVEPSLYISKRVGNIYTGSLYSCLYSLLCKKEKEI